MESRWSCDRASIVALLPQLVSTVHNMDLPAQVTVGVALEQIQQRWDHHIMNKHLKVRKVLREQVHLL